MMDLLYKEFMLARHPTLFIFPFLGAMLLIPSYPFFVAFVYTSLSVFFIFLQGRENKDILFTVSLPVRKRDVVKARCYFIIIIELFQIIISVPFALIRHAIYLNPKGNEAGIEVNIAFYGLVLILYALYNSIFLPLFYKTAYKAGLALLIAGFAITVYIVAIEAAVQFVPVLKLSFDTTDPGKMPVQVPVLIVGMGIFALSMWLAYRKSASSFEKVDL